MRLTQVGADLKEWRRRPSLRISEGEAPTRLDWEERVVRHKSRRPATSSRNSEMQMPGLFGVSGSGFQWITFVFRYKPNRAHESSSSINGRSVA